MHVTDKMDLVQDILADCGGEAKAKFLEVSTDFIKIYTRVPIDRVLPNRPVSFGTLFTKKMMNTEKVHSVRFLEADPKLGGCFILVSFHKEEK